MSSRTISDIISLLKKILFNWAILVNYIYSLKTHIKCVLELHVSAYIALSLAKKMLKYSAVTDAFTNMNLTGIMLDLF